MEEVWRDVPGYEGYYQVSDLGRVRSVDRWINGAFYKGKYLGRDNGHGYLAVCLCKSGINKNTYVHRVVLETFDPVENSSDLEVAHWNGIRSDNRLVNLRWTTHKENELDKFRHGTTPLGRRVEECVRGHDMSNRNLKEYRSGEIRTCWACKLMHKFFKRRGLSIEKDKTYAQTVSDIYYEQIVSGEDPYYEPDCNRGHLLEGNNLGIYRKYRKRYCKSCERARKRLNVNGYKASEYEIKKLADEIYEQRKEGGSQ